MSTGTGCLACTDPLPPCACSAGQICQVVQRSCNQCSRNECIDSDPSGSSGGNNLGTSIGGALGGVAAIAAALGLVYWFWWKPRGLAASRKRYSKHLSHRASKMMPPTLPADKGPSSPPGAGVAKRSSVHLNIGQAGENRLSRRTGSPSRGEESMPTSVGATQGSSRPSIDSDNPFGDHNRSSIGSFRDYPDDASTRTSDFSFRTSTSTNIIPIAYIPPHSNSMSVDDANRNAYGEVLIDTSSPQPRNSVTGRVPSRSSVPTSMASRDSLALAGAELINLHPLPPVLSPGSPVVPFGTSANGAPIRPPRSPGLDLQLPPGSNSPTPTSPRDSRLGLRPSSGFPFSAAPQSSTPSFLSAPPEGSRGMSVLLDNNRGGSHLSVMSTMTTSSSRSGGSTMSYILDPPQIITPVNAQGLRRVEVMGRGQAGLVTLAGSAAGSLPTTPAHDAVHSPAASGASSPTTPKAFAGQPTLVQQQQKTLDPFADENAPTRFSVGGIAAPTKEEDRRRRQSQDTIESVSSDPHFSVVDNASSRWTTSSRASSDRRASGESVALDPAHPSSPGRLAQSPNRESYGVPHSARSSEAYSDTGSRSRRLTGESRWTEGSSMLSASRRNSDATRDGSRSHGSVSNEGAVENEDSPRASFTSSRSGATDSMSMLDGIPFMGPPSSSNPPRSSTAPASTTSSLIDQPPASPLFPMPPPRTPSYLSASGPPSPTISDLPSDEANPRDSFMTASESSPAVGADVQPGPVPANLLAQGSATTEEDDNDDLPAPFLPFAGQRPTSSVTAGMPSDASARDSQAISVRSGFASGLSDVAFRLDGGLRDSMFTSGAPESERGSVVGPAGGASGTSERGSLLSVGGRGARDSIHDVGNLSGVEEEEGTSVAGSRPTSYASSVGGDEEEDEEVAIVTSAVRAPIVRSASVKRSPSNPSALASSPPSASTDEPNPFGDEAAVDPRASINSFAINAALSRSLAEED